MEAEIYWLTKRDQRNWHVCNRWSPPFSSWNRRPEACRGTVLLLPQGDKPEEDENHMLEMADHKDKVWKTDTMMELLHVRSSPPEFLLREK